MRTTKWTREREWTVAAAYIILGIILQGICKGFPSDPGGEDLQDIDDERLLDEDKVVWRDAEAVEVRRVDLPLSWDLGYDLCLLTKHVLPLGERK